MKDLFIPKLILGTFLGHTLYRILSMISEQHERSKIVHCKDCKYWDDINGLQGMCTKYYGLGSYDSDYCSMACKKDT